MRKPCISGVRDRPCRVPLLGVRIMLRATSIRRHGRTDMPRAKQASERKRRKEAVPVVGLVGASLSLASGASAATAVPTADIPLRDTAPPQITLNEEEIADVSLGTFYVFDKETAGTPRLGEQFARGCGRGCGGCRGCRGCGRGCRGCGGCGGCGCGGCGCCWQWGVCRVC
jgi:hypothetical protein